jgi:hypothetical protein
MASSGSLFSQFTYTDQLSVEEFNAACPAMYRLATSPFVGETGARLQRLYMRNESSKQAVDDFLRSADLSLYKVWHYKLENATKLMVLDILANKRQMYSYTHITRATPWEVAKDGRVVSTAQQSCSWLMCSPKALVANDICRLYKVRGASSQCRVPSRCNPRTQPAWHDCRASMIACQLTQTTIITLQNQPWSGTCCLVLSPSTCR